MSTDYFMNTETSSESIINIDQNNKPEACYFVFDVESIGLHGPAYAVAWVVVNKQGLEMESGLVAVPKEVATGPIIDIFEDDLKWLSENVPNIPATTNTHDTLRVIFWNRWKFWKERGAIMVSDCGWPVEANFLSWCVAWDEPARKWEGPYPLMDLSSIHLAIGFNPIGTEDRRENELPKHHPLCDSRQSARLLLEALDFSPENAPPQRAREGQL